MKRIFITGCARSGTTLLNRLFHAFDGVHVLDHEVDIDTFLGVPVTDRVLVCKRSPRTLFSVPLATSELERQAGLLSAPDIVVFNLIRDGRDVVHQHPRGPRVNLNRWIGCILQSRRYGHLLADEFRYEDLVLDPNHTQARIASVTGLRPRAEFQAYPDFVPQAAFEEPEYRSFPQYDARPIDSASIGHRSADLAAISASEDEYDLFVELLQRLGYVEGGPPPAAWSPTQLAEDWRRFEAASRLLGYRVD